MKPLFHHKRTLREIEPASPIAYPSAQSDKLSTVIVETLVCFAIGGLIALAFYLSLP